jgi:hypothetical protein
MDRCEPFNDFFATSTNLTLRFPRDLWGAGLAIGLDQVGVFLLDFHAITTRDVTTYRSLLATNPKPNRGGLAE